jgi:hypothetical protein
MVFVSVSSAQTGQSTDYLKSGDTLNGIVTILRHKPEIKYKLNETDEFQVIYYNSIDFIEMISRNDNRVKFKFLYVERKEQIIPLREREEGFISYYLNVLPAANWSIHEYYVKKAISEDLYFIGTNQNSNKKIRSSLATYFSDCYALVLKIENKEYKKESIGEAVKYYNSNCQN